METSPAINKQGNVLVLVCVRAYGCVCARFHFKVKPARTMHH